MDNSDTYISQPENDGTSSNKKGKVFLSNLHDIVILVAVILLVFSVLLRVVIVSGHSMNDTLVNGDCLLLLSNLFYREPERGDIIVARKADFEDGKPIIKRVIATEGQKVNIDFDAGIVYVDDVALDEPYTLTPTTLHEGVSFPLTVDKGCVFVLGDNRDESKDSRSPEIGLIDCREILGKAIFVLFPGDDDGDIQRDLSRIGVIS